jgi:hypothetical protein
MRRRCEQPLARLRASSTRYGDEAIQPLSLPGLLRSARNDEMAAGPSHGPTSPSAWAHLPWRLGPPPLSLGPTSPCKGEVDARSAAGGDRVSCVARRARRLRVQRRVTALGAQPARPSHARNAALATRRQNPAGKAAVERGMRPANAKFYQPSRESPRQRRQPCAVRPAVRC